MTSSDNSLAKPVTAVRNVRPWGNELSDIVISDDTITALQPASGEALAPGEVDGGGGLALPGFVNAHAHLDKSWWGKNWVSNPGRPTVNGRIEWERERRGALGLPSPECTSKALWEMVRHGTTAIRTHIDIDLGIGLRGLEVVQDVVGQFGGAIQVEVVAFPQDGVLRRPGVARLLEKAIGLGATHVGGLDPASIDRDPVGQIEVVFGLAAAHGVGVDLHLHDPGELGAFEMELIVEATHRHDLTGRVTISHAFAISQVEASRRLGILQALASAGISLATVAPLRHVQLPLAELDKANIRVAFGTDGIRDLWSPYGTGDMLAIAWQFARASNLVTDDDLMRVVEVLTRDAGFFVGRQHHDLVVGARADIVVLPAENPMGALVSVPPRRLVVAGGQLLYSAATT